VILLPFGLMESQMISAEIVIFRPIKVIIASRSKPVPGTQDFYSIVGALRHRKPYRSWPVSFQKSDPSWPWILRSRSTSCSFWTSRSLVWRSTNDSVALAGQFDYDLKARTLWIKLSASHLGSLDNRFIRWFPFGALSEIYLNCRTLPLVLE